MAEYRHYAIPDPQWVDVSLLLPLHHDLPCLSRQVSE